MANEKQLNGIAGWLLLLTLGVLIWPAYAGFKLVYFYFTTVSNGLVFQLLSIESASHNLFFGQLIVGNLMAYFLLFVLSSWVMYLFFRKSSKFKWLFICVMFFGLLVMGLSDWFGDFMYSGKPYLSSGAFKDLLALIFVSVLCTLYLLLSKRVKQTFTA